MNRVEQRHRISDLVRLQGADEVQFESFMPRCLARDQRRPFGLGLLDAVLPEHALTGGDDRLDRIGTESFRYRYQRHGRRIAAGVAAGPRDVLAHRNNAAWSIHGFHLVNAAANVPNFSECPKPTFTHLP